MKWKISDSKETSSMASTCPTYVVTLSLNNVHQEL